MNRRTFLQTSSLLALFPQTLLTACGAAEEAAVQPSGLALQTSDLIFNQRITNRTPFKVSTDVRATLEEAVATGRPLRVLGGGHGYLGSAVVKDGLVIDMRPRRGVRLDRASQQLTVEAGARFVDVYRALLQELGDELPYVLPTGDCPTVGVAGYTLGGGYGHLSRRLGLMCDNVVALSVLVVDPKGTVVEKRLSADSRGEDRDLFWALRGAGGARFAVITDFTFQLRPRPSGVRVYDLRLKGDLAPTALADTLAQWLAWVSEHLDDPTLSSKLALGSSWLHVSGLHESPAALADLTARLRPYLDDAHPDRDLDFRVESLTRAFKQCGSLEDCEAQPKKAFAARSAFLGCGGLSDRAEAIAEVVAERRARYGTYGGIELMTWRMQGGLDTDNAFVHRDHDLIAQLYAEGDGDEREPWMASMFRATTGKDTNDEALPGYQNYTDGSLAGAETGFPAAYFSGGSGSKGVRERLERIKARYRDVFTA